MKYLIDTNICIYWLNGDLAIEKKALKVGLKNIAISFITISELLLTRTTDQENATKNLKIKWAGFFSVFVF